MPNNTQRRLMKFLIIDNLDLMTRVLIEQLKVEGHEFIRLDDISTALKWLEENLPDAVILEINHKESDEVSASVSNIRQLCNRPVILYTALGAERDLVQKAMQAGAQGRVSKKMSRADKVTSAIMKIFT